MKQSVESFSRTTAHRATAPRTKVRAATRLGHFGLGGLPVYLCLLVLTVFLIFGHVVRASAHDIGDFVGRYSGSAELPMSDGTKDQRDLSIVISETDKGFKVQWNTVTEKEDGRRREKSYEVEFIPSDRSGIYAAAMQRNVFGHEVQQDPMKGQPYVWARLSGDTLTVFSMFIHQNGDYEMQQYDRRLTENGLSLVFHTHRNGQPVRRIETELLRR